MKDTLLEKAFYEKNPHIEENPKILLEIEEAINKPGLDSILLKGHVQSGKTSTYILLAARSMDKNYDGCITFTKNANDILNQTKSRFLSTFETVEDNLTVIDINENLEDLTKYELNQNIIIVAKKQTNDFEKINKLFDKYPFLQEKRFLVVDDESDWGSNGYNKSAEKEEDYFKKICKELLDLRKRLINSKYLSVTATPLSLFFANYWMIRPHAIFLLPPHKKYLGAEELFLSEENTMRRICENFVEEKEFEAIVNADINNIDFCKELPQLTKAVFDFILGGLLLKQEKHYSMLIHIDTTRKGHAKQKETIKSLIAVLKQELNNGHPETVAKLYKSYDEITTALDYTKYSFEEVKSLAIQALEEQVKVTLMNSDSKKSVKLDSNGNIKNPVPFSIFIGAFAVDRGVTFNNMISFVFGRDSKIANMDSSLQQLRILGARPKEDLPVTRIYCTKKTLKKWKEFTRIDVEFNKNIELLLESNKLASKTDLSNQLNYLVPSTKMEGVRLCAPQKIDTRLKQFEAYSRLLPKGFLPDKDKQKLVMENTQLIEQYKLIYPVIEFEKDHYIEVPTEAAVKLLMNSYNAIYSDEVNLLNLLEQSLFFLKWLKKENGDKVLIYYKYNRNRKLIRKNGKYDDAPDSGKNGDYAYAKKIGVNHPVLMMLHQSGEQTDGIPFYWPVLMLPKNMPFNITGRTLN